MDLRIKIDLIMTKVEILKLKADNYNWQCHTPKDVQDQLEETLKDIDKELNKEK